VYFTFKILIKIITIIYLGSPVEKDTNITGLKVGHGRDSAWVCDSALNEKAEGW
jgi:hypothetical protein